VTTSIHSGIMVPLNQASVQSGLLSAETLKHYQAMEAEMKAATANYTKPAELGWDAIAAKGLITAEQYDSLKEQNMQNRYFKLPKADLVPLKDKGAKGLTEDGLAHKPQHIGGLVQGMMATGFPREKIAEGLAKRFAERAAQDPKVAVMVSVMFVQDKVKASLPQGTPDAQVQAAVMQAAQQFAASTPLPQIGAMFGWAVGAQFQAQMLKSPQMQETMKHAMGHHLMDAASQKAVENLIEEYAKVVGNPTLDRAALDAEIRKLNEKAEQTKVKFPSLNWEGLIRHVPPQGSRDVLLGVDGHSFAGLRPAFDIIDKQMGA
jgi:hypothetical protein